MPKYLITVLPTTRISNEISLFQKNIEADFGAVHAQKVPPHITVIPPFDCDEEKIETLMITLSQHLSKPISQINIHLDNFQRFDNRTLFVDVAKNEPFEHFCISLKQLFNQQKIIKQRTEKHFFVPHITLANKDINKKDFKALWLQFMNKKYQRNFDLTSIVILELKEFKWEVKKEIIFG